MVRQLNSSDKASRRPAMGRRISRGVLSYAVPPLPPLPFKSSKTLKLAQIVQSEDRQRLRPIVLNHRHRG